MRTVIDYHGWMAMLYRSFYGKDVPDNLCSFVWKLSLAIACTPIVLPAMILNRIFTPFQYVEDDEQYARNVDHLSMAYGTVVTFVIFILGSLYVGLLPPGMSEWIYLSVAMVGGYVTMFGAIFIAKLLVFACTVVFNYLVPDVSDQPYVPDPPKAAKPDNALTVAWKYLVAKKNKYCSTIEWKKK